MLEGGLVLEHGRPDGHVGGARPRGRVVHQRVYARRGQDAPQRSYRWQGGERPSRREAQAVPTAGPPARGARALCGGSARTGREEVLPFLRHHAPAEEPLRSAVLARALRDIPIITQQGLAALLLAAEPRPASV